MNISKKQLSLVAMIEKASWFWRADVNKSEYPDSMIDVLIEKGLVREFKGKLTSAKQRGE